MWLIVGLGNPGKKYDFTRHNIGFLAVDHFVKNLSAPSIDKSEHKALVSRFHLDHHELILAKPQTFMNLSGESVLALAQYYKVSPQNIITIHDEVDLPFGEIRLQKARGHGGHNGIRDIHKNLGSNDYFRFRLGVGRPIHPQQSIADFVLERFSKEEMQQLSEILDHCCDALELLIDHGMERATHFLNQPAPLR